MKAWQIQKIHPLTVDRDALVAVDVPVPVPEPDEVLIRVSVCAVCHTELDEVEGRAAPPVLPVIPGHQVVGRIETLADGDSRFRIGDRVGVAWIYSACRVCEFCRTGLPNLCDHFVATGRDRDGGYAEYMRAHRDYIYRIPDIFSDEEAAPLLCAGAIGYRSLKLTGLKNGQNLGLTGFGASGHQVLKMASYLYPDSPIYVFARSDRERAFALDIGARWAGDSSERAPAALHAIIDTTPVWKPVIEALNNLEKGGRLVINAIRKEDVDKEEWLRLSYAEQLWMEKEIKSVANITDTDVSEFLELAATMKLEPEYQVYQMSEANEALRELKQGNIHGAKVLRIRSSVIGEP